MAQGCAFHSGGHMASQRVRASLALVSSGVNPEA